MAYRHAYLELFRVIGEKLELTEGQRTQWLQFLTDVETWDSGTDATKDLVLDYDGILITDHTELTTIGVNSHATIDLHLAHATGHPNSVVSSSEPADGTLAINEGAFWSELV